MADISGKSIFDFGFNENLFRITTTSEPNVEGSPLVPNLVAAELDPLSIGGGELGEPVSLVEQFIQSSNYVANSTGWRIDSDGNAFFVTVTINGILHLTVQPGDDVQAAIDLLEADGGGVIRFAAGTHTITTALVGVSAIRFIGENTSTTILDFNSTSANFTFAGTSIYTTGTITAVTSGVLVEGSGTAWLSNITTSHQILIANRWYRVASITDDTNLVLSEGHDGAGSFPGQAYRAAVVVEDIEFEELTIINSTGTAFDFDDCRNILFDDVEIANNAVGVTFDNCSEVVFNTVLVPSSTGNGVEINNCALTNFSSFSVPASGGHGFVINDARLVTIRSSSFAGGTSATSDGLNVTSGDTITLTTTNLSANGRHGAHLVSGNRHINFNNCNVNGNTTDGIRLAATSDECKIANSDLDDNGGFGVVVGNSNCDNNQISDSFFDNNTSGNISDSGTGTLIRDNIPNSVNDATSDAILLDSSNTDVTVSGTTTETSIYSFSLSGGVLSTGNAIEIIVPFKTMVIDAGDTLTIKLKYGGTDVAAAVAPAPDAGDTASAAGMITATLFADGATNSQFGFCTWSSGLDTNSSSSSTPPRGASDDGTATEDSTGALTVDIRVVFSTNASDNNIVSLGGWTKKLTA